MSSADELSESTTIATTDDCLSTTVDDESVVLHVGQGKYYGFNEVGTFVWERIQKPRTVGEVCDDVLAEYDVDEQRCLRDVRALLIELVDENLARIVDD